MNEQKKYIYVIAIIMSVFSLFWWGSVRCIESRDYALREARTELRETADRLRDADARVEQLENELTRVAEGLGNIHKVLTENRNGLHESIERLRAIAEEVEALEDRLRDINSDSGSDRASVDILAE